VAAAYLFTWKNLGVQFTLARSFGPAGNALSFIDDTGEGMKKAISLALLGLALAGSAQAMVLESEGFLAGPSNNTIATAQDLGSLGSASSVQLYGSRLDLLPGGDSADFFKITLTSAATLSLSVDTVFGRVYLNDPMVALFSSTGQKLYENDDYNGYDSFLSYAAAAGTYYVGVTGFGDRDFLGGGSSNWTYGLTAATAPVPEPETLALMLAGLGVVGGSAARRRRQQQAGS
jgi:hypothetical protein